MKLVLLAFAAALPMFVVIDMAWLLGPGRPFYVSEIGNLLRASPNMAAAGIFYLLYCAGLVFFVINGAVQSGNAYQALVYGALFGLVAYGTYDLTNLSVLNGFTVKIAMIDMLWGTILSGVVAWLATQIALKLA
jgi:uncharacterized membrane protein